MVKLSLERTPIADAWLWRRPQHLDARGYLERVFDEETLGPILDGRPVKQVNRTVTRRAGTLRGLHVQLPPHVEAKLVTCLRGSAFDVLVDLRASSATFGTWWSCELQGGDGITVVVPEGCAHGLQTLADDTEMLYVHTAAYVADFEAAVNPLDDELAVAWPRPVTVLSNRDAAERRSVQDFEWVAW